MSDNPKNLPPEAVAAAQRAIAAAAKFKKAAVKAQKLRMEHGLGESRYFNVHDQVEQVLAAWLEARDVLLSAAAAEDGER